MFPSAGYFRGVMCPFFAHGLCHRPYCHFKHVAPVLYWQRLTGRNNNVDHVKSIQFTKQTCNETTKEDRKPSTKVQHTTRSETNQPRLSKDVPVPNTLQSKHSMGQLSHRTSVETSKESVLDPQKSAVKDSSRKQPHPITVGSAGKDVDEERYEPTNDPQIVSEGSSTDQQIPTESSAQKTDFAEKNMTESEAEETFTDQESYFDDISSAVDRVLSAYSMPASDNITVADSDRGSLISGSTVTPDKANEQSQLPRPKEKYGMIGGVRIKKRIAHPGAGAAKVQTEEEKRQTACYAVIHAPVVSKKRVAHTSMVSSSQSSKAQRPVIPLKAGGKIPTNLRQKYLDCFVDEYLKICSSEKEAYDKAKAEEEAVFTTCNMRQSYTNKSSLALKRLRNRSDRMYSQASGTEKKAHEAEKSKGQSLPSESVDMARAEKLKQNARDLLDSLEDAEPVAKKQKSTEDRESTLTVTSDSDTLPGDKLHQLLQPYLLSDNQLREFGFPRPHQSSSTVATIAESGLYKSHPIKQLSDAELQHTCCRCSTLFSMTPDGWYITKEKCLYHYGRLRKVKETGEIHTVYSCCQGVSTSKGCQVAEWHVTNGEQDNIRGGFVTTKEVTDGDSSITCPGVYALDCEMCYTAAGLELTRVTVVDHMLKCTYETLVKPDLPIVDYNSRFSGITAPLLAAVTTRLQDVQQHLLTLFSVDTILLGHSLNSDLVALKLIHNKVVDTSIVFPHPRGLPYRRALRTLAADILRKIIQENEGGHDSFEDSAVCMELIIWKTKQDLNKQRRKPTVKVK